METWQTLQWSHVFSDMVSRSRSAPRVRLTMLQWSHVFSDMVRGITHHHLKRESGASMVPCLFRHGKRLWEM